MGWSGGVYTRTNGVYSGSGVWASDEGAAVKILSSRHDTHDQDLATGINSCLAKDGSNAATSNLNLGGFRYTNAAVATSNSDLARASQVIDASLIYAGTTAGTTTAYTLTPSIVITRTVGMIVRAKIHATSTGTATLNVSGTGAANIVSRSGSQVPTGTLLINTYLDFMWDGTNWMVVGPHETAWTTFSPSGIAASGTYTITTTNYARWKYRYDSHSLLLQFFVLGTTSLSTSYIGITIPFTVAEVGDIITCQTSDGGASRPAQGVSATTTQLSCYMWDTTTSFTAGVNRAITANGEFKLS